MEQELTNPCKSRPACHPLSRRRSPPWSRRCRRKPCLAGRPKSGCPQPYAVYVDDQDQVWLSDFGANALVQFDPQSETFTVYTLPSPTANVRQILGRPGEVWGAEVGRRISWWLSTRLALINNQAHVLQN